MFRDFSMEPQLELDKCLYLEIHPWKGAHGSAVSPGREEGPGTESPAPGPSGQTYASSGVPQN